MGVGGALDTGGVGGTTVFAAFVDFEPLAVGGTWPKYTAPGLADNPQLLCRAERKKSRVGKWDPKLILRVIPNGS